MPKKTRVHKAKSKASVLNIKVQEAEAIAENVLLVPFHERQQISEVDNGNAIRKQQEALIWKHRCGIELSYEDVKRLAGPRIKPYKLKTGFFQLRGFHERAVALDKKRQEIVSEYEQNYNMKVSLPHPPPVKKLKTCSAGSSSVASSRFSALTRDVDNAVEFLKTNYSNELEEKETILFSFAPTGSGMMNPLTLAPQLDQNLEQHIAETQKSKEAVDYHNKMLMTSAIVTMISCCENVIDSSSILSSDDDSKKLSEMIKLSDNIMTSFSGKLTTGIVIPRLCSVTNTEPKRDMYVAESPMEDRGESCLKLRLANKYPELHATNDGLYKYLCNTVNGEEEIATCSNIRLIANDFKTLSPTGHLNDNVLMAYAGLLMERSRQDGMSQIHIFDTLFFSKLKQGGYDSVKNWFKKVDIFKKTLLFIPINENNHWSLVMVNLDEKTITHFNSINSPAPFNMLLVVNYMMKKYNDAMSGSLDFSEWEKIEAKDIPRQRNGYDCGMFLCKYMEYLSCGDTLDFSQEDMPYFRKRMVDEIYYAQLLY